MSAWPASSAKPVNHPGQLPVAQPVAQPGQLPVAQPVATTATGQPVAATAAGQPLAVQPVPIVVQEIRPQAMSRDVEVFGFVLKDTRNIHNAKSLAGIYFSCVHDDSWFPGDAMLGWWASCPAPCLSCRRFSAQDDHTLVLANGCCCGCPEPAGQTFHRNWDENGQPGPPNSFSSAAGGDMEFGACNGLCAGSNGHSGSMCYLRCA